MRHDDEGFDVFLCHNTADKPAVKAIAERLHGRGLRPWLDEWTDGGRPTGAGADQVHSDDEI